MTPDLGESRGRIRRASDGPPQLSKMIGFRPLGKMDKWAGNRE